MIKKIFEKNSGGYQFVAEQLQHGIDAFNDVSSFSWELQGAASFTDVQRQLSKIASQITGGDDDQLIGAGSTGWSGQGQQQQQMQQQKQMAQDVKQSQTASGISVTATSTTNNTNTVGSLMYLKIISKIKIHII